MLEDLQGKELPDKGFPTGTILRDFRHLFPTRVFRTGCDDDCVEFSYEVAQQGILDDELALFKGRHFGGGIQVLRVIDYDLDVGWGTLSLNWADLKKEDDSGYSYMPTMTAEFSGMFTSPTTLRYFFSKCIHHYHHCPSPLPAYPLLFGW